MTPKKTLWLSVALMALQACAFLEAPRYTATSFPAIPNDQAVMALDTFRTSCQTKMPSAFEYACRQASALEEIDTTIAENFFTYHFDAYHVHQLFNADGFVTGYYEPVLYGSLTKSDRYSAPLYAPPRAVKEGEAFAARKEIEDKALLAGTEVLWLEDEVESFFLHIQGSGKIILPDGKMVTAQFAGKNQQPYTPIGRILKERSEIPPDEISLQSIKAWLHANPEQATEVMQQNDTYVFFAVKEHADPARGAQGVSLSAEHSIAVDPHYTHYGTPIWLETALADGSTYQQLLIAQDTGGAIKGPMRGDIYFGRGKPAEAKAGGLQSAARWTMLWPKGSLPYAPKANR